MNILQFTATLPLGQTLRVRGEDILSEPDVYLPQIAEWLGIRTDSNAIEAMKHPEHSPYACVGPDAARGGNDPKFMRSPELRGGTMRKPSLDAFLESENSGMVPSAWSTEPGGRPQRVEDRFRMKRFQEKSPNWHIFLAIYDRRLRPARFRLGATLDTPSRLVDMHAASSCLRA